MHAVEQYRSNSLRLLSSPGQNQGCSVFLPQIPNMDSIESLERRRAQTSASPFGSICEAFPRHSDVRTRRDRLRSLSMRSSHCTLRPTHSCCPLVHQMDDATDIWQELALPEIEGIETREKPKLVLRVKAFPHQDRRVTGRYDVITNNKNFTIEVALQLIQESAADRCPPGVQWRAVALSGSGSGTAPPSAPPALSSASAGSSTSTSEPPLPQTMRFRISLVLQTPSATGSSSLDRLRITQSHPPLLLLCGTTELDVPINGRVVAGLRLGAGVTSRNYHEHRGAWHPAHPAGGTGASSGAGPSGAGGASGEALRHDHPIALFRLRVQPTEPSAAATHPQLTVETVPAFQVTTRLLYRHTTATSVAAASLV